MAGADLPRLISLDAFRGMTIAAMILVNNPGSWDAVYPPLRHAHWHGCTPTDLIFPFFIFIMGVAMTFSLGRADATKSTLYPKIVRRSLILIGLGLFLSAFPSFNLGELRVAGVLQRIGVVYFLGALLVLNCSIRCLIWTAASLLLLYWTAMSWIPVPGVGAGIWTPSDNLASYLDQILLPGRMWQESWDPEGILSTAPALATALMGVLAGFWIRSNQTRQKIAGCMFGIGWVAISVGIAWGLWFPINKSLWTSSYVMFTGGVALVALSVCYWLIEVGGYRRFFYPAVVFGMNSILVFFASGLVSKTLGAVTVSWTGKDTSLWDQVYIGILVPSLSPAAASLAQALVYVFLWYLVMDVLYRRKLFVKI